MASSSSNNPYKIALDNRIKQIVRLLNQFGHTLNKETIIDLLKKNHTETLIQRFCIDKQSEPWEYDSPGGGTVVGEYKVKQLSSRQKSIRKNLCSLIKSYSKIYNDYIKYLLEIQHRALYKHIGDIILQYSSERTNEDNNNEEEEEIVDLTY